MRHIVPPSSNSDRRHFCPLTILIESPLMRDVYRESDRPARVSINHGGREGEDGRTSDAKRTYATLFNKALEEGARRATKKLTLFPSRTKANTRSADP